ncbi:hypothetical protein BDP27DRAFT_1335410 [Rhodocollybia butyracea]|uniref:HNH nuclease domain-containing protein n=1 Tax=Rhodocollybia butyracea TaxID=206335 RepID=A0A9P5U328_9AGAR|nr:hypothetical protein BDP27DRAFT_1335410 [Rhodocollybia butyracea]
MDDDEIRYDTPVLPSAGSSATAGFNEHYTSCYNLILEAERNALKAYATTCTESSRQNIMAARVTGGFLIHLYSKRRILGDGPARSIVSQVTSGSIPAQEVIYSVGRELRDRLIFSETVNKDPAPSSNHPSRPSFDTLQEMLAQTIQGSGTDYRTARNKTLARDGYRCMLTGAFDVNSCSRNRELAILRKRMKAPAAEVQSCHILNKITLQGVGEPDGSETASSRAHAAGVMAILKQFRLGHLVDKLIEKGGIHRLCNLLSLIQPLHHAFDHLNLWFDETDEENVYEVHAVQDILSLFARVNRRPHFMVNEELKNCLTPVLLALHAVCARVAHMSGAAEYFDELERDKEDTLVVTEESLPLLNNLLSPFAVQISVH